MGREEAVAVSWARDWVRSWLWRCVTWAGEKSREGEGADGGKNDLHFPDEDLLGFRAEITVGSGLDFVEVLDDGSETVCYGVIVSILHLIWLKIIPSATSNEVGAIVEGEWATE